MAKYSRKKNWCFSAPHLLKTSKSANPEAALPLLMAKFKPGFLLRILWCSSQSGNHPKNNLVKFGYIIIHMKVGKRAESLYIPGYLLEGFIIHWQFGILKIWQIWAIFFPWKILLIDRNRIILFRSLNQPSKEITHSVT